MEPLLVALSAVFGDVPREALRATLPLWSVVQARENAMLWKQGRPADSFAVIHAGELEMSVDGTVLGRIGPSEMIGEAALYATDALRFASMRARIRTQALLLPLAGVAQLRAQGGPVYDAILQRAIAGAAQRGHSFDRQLAQVRKGNFAAPQPESSGLFQRLWRRVARSAPDPAGCPPLAGLLAQNPVLARASAEVRDALVRGFEPVAFRAGQFLTRQGDADARVFVVAEGKADVLRTIEAHGGALLLERLEPGQIVGVHGFFSGGPRTASILGTTDGWAHAMTREAFERLPPAARTAWLEVTLAVSVRQYQAAAQGLQVAIGVFASRHEEMMPSRVMLLRDLRDDDPRKRR